MPLRQFVLTLPHPLRPRVAYDRELSSRIYAIFYDSIQRFYRQRLAERSAPAGRTGLIATLLAGVTCVTANPLALFQTFLSLLAAIFGIAAKAPGAVATTARPVYGAQPAG